MMGYGDGWGWMGMSFMLLFWFGLVALIIWAISGWRPDRTPTMIEGRRDDHALAILSERYARGETTNEEFEQRRNALQDARR